jgi:dienelactone hydrolase
MVEVWYPANPSEGATTAPYFPEMAKLAQSVDARELNALFRAAWPSVRDGAVLTHSFADAPVLQGKQPYPVLLFSPGLCGPVFSYSAQLENLASLGYVIFALEPTHAVTGVVFPDGRIIPCDETLPPSQPMSDEELRLGRQENDAWAADVRFVLDRVVELNGDSRGRFYHKLDATKVGAFGHSSGGRTAVRACQTDARIRACLNEDGTWSWFPFWPDDNGNRIDQPFMMLDHRDPELPDEAFTAMHTTREAYVARRNARIAIGKTMYEAVRGGSYRVTITTPDVDHGSFADVRMLQAVGDPVRSAHFTEILALTREYTVAFFDKYLKGVNGTAVDSAPPANSSVIVQKYSPAKE